MAKVLVDIGAHLGETLEVALDERWGFDRIFCFEPAPSCWSSLEALADDRVTINRFGLWKHDDSLLLYNPGEIGASIFASKDTPTHSVEVTLRDAASWFRENLTADDEIFVKVNCEGAECDILDELMDENELDKVDVMLVHFDVRKVPELTEREADTRRRLDLLGVAYRSADTIMFGRNTPEKTKNWLKWLHAPTWMKPYYSVGKRLEFYFRVKVYEWRRQRRH